MGNVNKSDEMFKTFVAQVAGQATAIFLQAKAEKQEITQQAFEVHDDLRLEIEDYEQNLRQIEVRYNQLIEKHSQEILRLDAEAKKYKKFWHDTLKANKELTKERNDLLDRLSLDDLADEIMGPPKGGKK